MKTRYIILISVGVLVAAYLLSDVSAVTTAALTEHQRIINKLNALLSSNDHTTLRSVETSFDGTNDFTHTILSCDRPYIVINGYLQITSTQQGDGFAGGPYIDADGPNGSKFDKAFTDFLFRQLSESNPAVREWFMRPIADETSGAGEPIALGDNGTLELVLRDVPPVEPDTTTIIWVIETNAKAICNISITIEPNV